MPKGGLKQLILNNTYQLKLDKVVNIAKNKFNNLQKQISINFIVDVIQYIYPAAVNSIFNFNIDIEYPHIPVINILPYKRTEYITLRPILNNKAFINSNYYIIKNIFLDQLQYNYKTAINN